MEQLHKVIESAFGRRDDSTTDNVDTVPREEVNQV
ncbi:2,3,4,5-tetrahydropyridine-2,6-dicarboxylate N-succinyltransferase, partial [Klebsiella pneumoniae]|nr:2,3,4,5-tetrahydropyridine-2,6-dicarboxylate N-succinyltransferase [Klebsiella pneumoniae]